MTSVFERLLNMSITGSIVIAVVLLARLSSASMSGSSSSFNEVIDET